MAFVYPRKMRSTRDLLRRRMYLMHHRSEILAHVQNTNSQYNLPMIGKKIAYKSNRSRVAERFEEPSVQKSIEVDLQLLDFYDPLIRDLECTILKMAKAHDPISFHLLKTMPGTGDILSMSFLYEIYDICRFPTVSKFVSCLAGEMSTRISR